MRQRNRLTTGRTIPPAGAGGADGFTLLEVLMATSLLAVGAVSVLLVLASAAGYASQRQGQQRLTQVLEEARNDARSRANAFVPTADAKVPGGEDGKIDAQQSTLYPGFSYELAFAPVDKDVPEAGYQVTVTVRYGDAQEHDEVLVVGSDTVPDQEFTHSVTWDEERAGQADTTGGNEAK